MRVTAFEPLSHLIFRLMKSVHSIRTYRRRYALTQEELADLVSVSQSRLSRIESHEESPSLETAFGLQVVFDIQPRIQVRGLYARVEEQVMAKAAILDRTLRGRTDWDSQKKQKLLGLMARRAKAPAAAA